MKRAAMRFAASIGNAAPAVYTVVLENELRGIVGGDVTA
jgi:hypothetical protein